MEFSYDGTTTSTRECVLYRISMVYNVVDVCERSRPRRLFFTRSSLDAAEFRNRDAEAPELETRAGNSARPVGKCRMHSNTTSFPDRYSSMCVSVIPFPHKKSVISLTMSTLYGTDIVARRTKGNNGDVSQYGPFKSCTVFLAGYTEKKSNASPSNCFLIAIASALATRNMLLDRPPSLTFLDSLISAPAASIFRCTSFRGLCTPIIVTKSGCADAADAYARRDVAVIIIIDVSTSAVAFVASASRAARASARIIPRAARMVNHPSRAVVASARRCAHESIVVDDEWCRAGFPRAASSQNARERETRDAETGCCAR